MHRFLGALAVTFTAVHVLGLLADGYIGFGPTDVLVPLASSWHPLAVAWGIVGMYLLVAVEATSLLRQHLSQQAWRAVHLLSYVVLAVTTVHLLAAGTDVTTVVPETLAVTVGIVAVFGGALLLTWRSAPRTRDAAATRPGGLVSHT